jgi:cytochrome c553
MTLAVMASLQCAMAGAPSVRQDFSRVIANKPDAERGAALYANCAGCHGAQGGGETSGAMPRIAGQHYRVLARQLVDFRRGQRWDFRMEAVAANHDILADLQDITDVAWFVSQLDRDGARGVGDGEYVDKGAAVFLARCASCHGASGQGDDARGVPRLSGQHAGYLARQIYDAVDGRRPALARTHRDRFEPLALDEIQGLADYLSRSSWQSGN